MTYSVIWTDHALASAHAHLDDDREGLLGVFDATDALATDPRPAAAFAWGMDRYRLRIGRYRVIYQVTDAEVTVEVLHLGHREQ